MATAIAGGARVGVQVPWEPPIRVDRDEHIRDAGVVEDSSAQRRLDLVLADRAAARG